MEICEVDENPNYTIRDGSEIWAEFLELNKEEKKNFYRHLGKILETRTNFTKKKY